jgi:hypothetical protein
MNEFKMKTFIANSTNLKTLVNSICSLQKSLVQFVFVVFKYQSYLLGIRAINAFHTACCLCRKLAAEVVSHHPLQLRSTMPIGTILLDELSSIEFDENVQGGFLLIIQVILYRSVLTHDWRGKDHRGFER